MRRFRARRSRFGKDRAETLARFEHSLDVHDVGRSNPGSHDDEIVTEESVDPRFAVQAVGSYSICVVPENTNDPAKRPNHEDLPSEKLPIPGTDDETLS